MEYPIRLICGECDGKGFKVDPHYECAECHGKGDLNEEVDNFYYLEKLEVSQNGLVSCIAMLEANERGAEHIGDHKTAQVLSFIIKQLKRNVL